MTFLLQQTDPLDLPQGGINEPLGGFVENWRAAKNSFRVNDREYSKATVLQDQWDPIVDILNQRSDKFFLNPTYFLEEGMVRRHGSREQGEQIYEKAAANYAKYIRENPDLFPELQWVTPDEILNRGKAAAVKSREDLFKLTETSPGALNSIARFAGAATALISDPYNLQGGLLSAPIGGGKTMIGTFLKHAMVNAGIEAFAQPGVKSWYEELGYEYTAAQFWTSVTTAGVVGGALPLVFKIGGKTISLTAEQAKKGYQAFKNAGYKPPPYVDVMARWVDDVDIEDAAAPISDFAEHTSRANQAQIAVEHGVPVDMPSVPASRLLPYEPQNLDGVIYKFDPNEIEVDAKTFQFKSGGDEFGVTERLQGVTEWDPDFAGEIMVYEYANGRRVIADGHQRLGLAKRIMAQTPGKTITLYGKLVREVDGVTPERAMVKAALVNIANGTGTAIDVAKIFRVNPDQITRLPPASALVRQANDLKELSDEAFMVAYNEVVPANYAAVVGRLIPRSDPGLQMAALSVLQKMDPANEFQAETIVRQVRESGAQKMTQEGLFGDEIITESYFAERMKIMDKAQKQLRQDKAAFGTLVRNAERLEAEGNQLARQSNERRLTNDAQAIALLQTLAHRKGAISDALNDAARLARETGSYAEPVRNFIEAIRRGAQSGDFDRISASDVGQSINDQAPSPTAKDVSDAAVEQFDGPGSAGSIDQASQLSNDLFAEPPLREAAQPDIALRQELRQLIEKNAPESEIDSHPAVVNAIAAAKAIPETHLVDGYGSDLWLSSRQFNIDGETVVGYENAVQRLYERAQRLAWTDDKLTAPDVPTKFEKRAVIVLGPPAAGKSTIANPIAQKLGAVVIDPDDVKKALPEYNNGIGANAVHEESSMVANMIESYALSRGENVLIPKVGSNPASIKGLITRLRNNGYEIDLVDMKVDYAIARNRMFLRFVDTGRLVSPSYVRKVGNTPGKTYDILKEEGAADGYTRIDNNVPKGAERPIIEDTRNLLDGGRLRLRESGGPGAGDGAQRTVTEAIAEDFEQVAPGYDLDMDIPVAMRVDAETGEIAAQTTTLRQIKESIDQDQKMFDRLKGCVK